jgi:hypothetical protein
MNNTTAINLIGDSPVGLNLQQLRQSEYFGDEYIAVLKNSEGSLTQVYGYDVSSTFMVAKHDLRPNPLQTEILNTFLYEFFLIEDKIDPQRLQFTITKAMDDEICINRDASFGGRVKVIIHDDGVIALSFLPDANNRRKKELIFCKHFEANYDKISLRFFSF